MARVKFGPSLVGIRGTIGGMTFSANGSSNYIKAWAGPTNPRSNLQAVPRVSISGAGAAWRGLTDGQRSDWATWAADAAQELTDQFGDPYYVSGWNWFCTLRQWALSTEQVPPEDAPVLTRPVMPSPTGATLETTGNGTLTVSFAAGDFEDLYLVAAVSVRTASNAVFPGRGQSRWFGVGPFDASDDEAVITDLSDKLGGLTAGQSFLLDVYAQNDESNRGVSTSLVGTVT